MVALLDLIVLFGAINGSVVGKEDLHAYLSLWISPDCGGVLLRLIPGVNGKGDI